MSALTAQDIRNAFESQIDDPKLLNECLALCRDFNLDPENLRWKVEAVNFKGSITHSELSPVTSESLSAVKLELQRELVKEKKPQRTTTVAANVNVNRARMPAAFRRNMSVPGIPGRSVVAQVKQEEVQAAGSSKVVFSGPKQDEEAKSKRAYRYMFEKQVERGSSLDHLLDDVAELTAERFKMNKLDLGDPTTATEEDIIVVGRICYDPDTESPKLTENSIWLESSRALSGGARIALKFDPGLVIQNNIKGAKALGLFPGAIVVVKGKNGGGDYFLVNELHALPVPKPETGTTTNEKTNDVMKVDPVEPKPFSLAIACGPFTSDSNLDYEPWTSLVENLKTEKPSAVLLVGPFVDTLHSSIQAGDLDYTPTELFQKKIYQPLRTFLDASPGSIAIILPSVRDLISNHTVYPQSELSPSLVNNDPRVNFVPNPGKFKINDVSFGGCSVDVLFHLRKEEYLRTGKENLPVESEYQDDVGTDVMGNLCRHLLQQRSFYPIFPTPQDLTQEVNLDISHYNGLKLMGENEDSPPDILILPSKLKHFVKTVHSTTVINPSYLNRGTFTLLKVAQGDGVKSVKQRLDCEIMRLNK